MNARFFDSALLLRNSAARSILYWPGHAFLQNHAPQLFCYQETARLIWVNLITDAVIAGSYALIFGCLLFITLKLRRVAQVRRYLWVLASFGLFIAACGGTHLMDVIDLWSPHYSFATAVRLVCALASLPTAILFATITPSIIQSVRENIVQFKSMQRQRDEAQEALAAREALARERERSQAQLLQLNEQLTSVMNSTSDSIFQVSHNWAILYGNRQAMATLPDLVIGGDLWTCFKELHSTESGEFIRRSMALRTVERYESYYAPYKTWRSVHVFPIPEGISIFAKDITDEKKLQEALVQEKLLREEHIESLSHMAGGLAHEISNPLAIIHARASDLMESADSDDPPSSSEVVATCASIVRTADRAIRILRGLKGLARQAENDPMEYANIASTCDQCLEMQRSRFDRHQVAIRLHVQADLPLVLCRETQVGQVVTNLLNNAFDSIVQDGSTKHWISLDLNRQNAFLSIRIANSGDIIPEEIRKRLMEPFFTTKKFGQGMGVGLSLSRAIALDHHGSLTLLDDTDHTCFELLLPYPGELTGTEHRTATQ